AVSVEVTPRNELLIQTLEGTDRVTHSLPLPSDADRDRVEVHVDAETDTLTLSVPRQRRLQGYQVPVVLGRYVEADTDVTMDGESDEASSSDEEEEEEEELSDSQIEYF
ncbi:hypothetical protein KIPB_010044, partial [Kipferlia bialata]